MLNFALFRAPLVRKNLLERTAEKAEKRFGSPAFDALGMCASSMPTGAGFAYAVPMVPVFGLGIFDKTRGTIFTGEDSDSEEFSLSRQL